MNKYQQLPLPFDTNINSEVSSPGNNRMFQVVDTRSGTIYPIEADCPKTALISVMQQLTGLPLVDAIAVFEPDVVLDQGYWWSAWLNPLAVLKEEE